MELPKLFWNLALILKDLPRPKISLGCEHPSVQLKLVDPDTGAESDRGELWVKSKGVMLGYHGLPKQTLND